MDIEERLFCSYSGTGNSRRVAVWMAHDLLHLSQLIELRYQLLVRQAEPYGLTDAGSWE